MELNSQFGIVSRKTFQRAHTAHVNARERVRKRFDEWVETQRSKRVTQEKLGAQVHKSQGWVSKTTAKGPRLETLDDIAKLMGTTPEDLVKRQRSGVKSAYASVAEAPMDERKRVLIGALEKLTIDAQFFRAVMDLITKHAMASGREPNEPAKEADA